MLMRTNQFLLPPSGYAALLFMNVLGQHREVKAAGIYRYRLNSILLRIVEQ